MVLTAGLATRLRPLSDVRAKAALPIAGETLVSRILRRLHDAGVRRVVLNLHHRPETVTRVVGDGADWGLQVRYSWEPQILGSGGGPRRALALLDAPRVLIVNGDTLTDCDLRAVVQQHIATNARVTLAVIARPEPRAIIADEHGVVTGFGPGDEHFIGVQAVNADVFDSVPDDTPYEVIKSLYPAILQHAPGAIRVFRSRAEFLDVGTVADYMRTVDIVARREAGGLDRGDEVVIDPTAVVEHSILWNRVRVHAHARLADCVVADDVEIPAGARYARCAIVNGASGLTVSPIKIEA